MICRTVCRRAALSSANKIRMRCTCTSVALATSTYVAVPVAARAFLTGLLKAECLLYSAEKQFRNKKIVFEDSCVLKRAPQGAGLGPEGLIARNNPVG